MNTPNENHIQESIKSYYKRKLVSAVVFLAGIFVLSFFTSIHTLIFTPSLSGYASPETAYERNEKYVQGTVDDLYFTGYTRTLLGRTTGYYYYTMMNDKCVIVLLSPQSSEMGLSSIDSITTKFRINKDDALSDDLLTNLSRDLSWNDAGIRDSVDRYMLSEPDATGWFATLIRLIVIVASIYGTIIFLISGISILFPVLSRPIRLLGIYGNPREMLKQAEEELSTLPQLATEDMFITEHYFIETSSYGVAVLPIDKMLWIYKYSTLHKFLWHHFSISYTLYITAEKHRYLRCPKNTKTDIDGIMDYLAEANHNILVGFSEKNRLAIEEQQGEVIFLRKLWALLSRRV